MAVHRPSLFNDSDLVRFRQTPLSEYRVPYTFVEALNEGTLFDRSSRVFEEAARTQRLYDVVVGEDQRIIGAGEIDVAPENAGPSMAGITAAESMVGIPDGINKNLLIPGLKVNLIGKMLLSLNAMFTLNNNGLRPRTTPVAGVFLTMK